MIQKMLDGGEKNQLVPCDETVIVKFFRVLATNEALYACNISDALLFCLVPAHAQFSPQKLEHSASQEDVNSSVLAVG